MKKSLPTYNFLKKLDSPVSLEYSRLEVIYNPYDASHAHRHDYYEILYFEKSGGYHEIDFVRYPLKKNTLHFVSPGQVHLLGRDKKVTGHVIAFKPDAFISGGYNNDLLLMDLGNTGPVVSLDTAGKKAIEKSINDLIGEYKKQHSHSVFSLSAYLLLFLVEVIRQEKKSDREGAKKESNRLTQNFKRYINDHVMQQHSVSWYASQLNVSPGHLNDMVKEHTGFNASELIHQRLLLEAKRLLYHSELSVKEISAQLGYEDPAYFTRFFRKNADCTPVEFREAIRKRY